MSAFGGKADMTFRGMSAFAVAIGGKADMPFVALHMSAYDPKRTSHPTAKCSLLAKAGRLRLDFFVSTHGQTIISCQYMVQIALLTLARSSCFE